MCIAGDMRVSPDYRSSAIVRSRTSVHRVRADARSIDNPIDSVAFEGYTKGEGWESDTIDVVLAELKKGKGKRTWEESLIKRA